MTSRERILAVLRGEKPDRVPWIPICSWTYFESTPEHSVGADWMDTEALKIRLDFFNKIRADYMQWCAFPYYVDEYCSLILRTRSSADIEMKTFRDSDTVQKEYHTPVGTLTSISQYSETGHTIFNVKDLLETIEDLKVYMYIIENVAYEPEYERLEKYLEILGENGVLFVSSPPPPLKSFLLGTMRLQNAVFMIHDYKDEFDRLVKLVDEKSTEVYKILAESPATIFHDGAVTGLGMISPKIYEEYYLPYTKKYAAILHESGKLYTNHTSGEPIGNILNMIMESDIDGLYGLTYPPAVDTVISEVRDKFGGKIAVMGGIPSDFIATNTKEQVQEKAEEVLKDAAPGGHFMLGTVDDTPYGTPPENLKAVSEVVQRWFY
jgi:uroporphyrinogen-III decarboxylase